LVLEAFVDKSTRRTIASIDVGTTKVCTLLGEINERGQNPSDGELRIVGVGVSPSRGLRKGIVVNATEAAEAIVASVDRAERISGYDIAQAHVGIAGAHIASLNSRGVVGIPHGERGITEDDVARVLDASRAISVPEHHHVLHVIPRGYSIDGQEGVNDPREMYGARLEVEAHIVTGSSLSIQNLIKCVNSLNVEVDQLVLAPLAAGEAVLTNTERAMGVALADIGGGTTDIAIFIEGSVWHTAILPVGGHHLTNDVAICLRTPFDEAEEIKKKHGHACLDRPDADEEIRIAAFGEEAYQSVTKRELAQVLHARVQEIASLILQEIKRSGYDGLLPAGVVLCGGTAELAGICAVMREAIGLPVRVGRPHDLQGLVNVLTHPAYATSVGLLLWAQNEGQAMASHVPSEWGQFYDMRPRARLGLGPLRPGRVARWFRNLLPD
jgi:cell division protein FtsA